MTDDTVQQIRDYIIAKADCCPICAEAAREPLAALATLEARIADTEQANRVARDLLEQMTARAEAAEARIAELEQDLDDLNWLDEQGVESIYLTTLKQINPGSMRFMDAIHAARAAAKERP